ncbi:MAG: aldehyde dehydrogenase [Syntrophobacteraceae bacterium]|nr:aldehyde dehydrogenase [Syntrophobacteraceae bacterium]
MSLDEKLIERVVEMVVERLSKNVVEVQAQTGGAEGCPAVKDGVFKEMDDAINAAEKAQKALLALPLAVRGKIIQAMRDAGVGHAEEYAVMEFEETGVGKAADNAKKVLAACRVLGMEDLGPECYTGDKGLTVIERIPFGLISSVNPVTLAVPTIYFNAIMTLAGGNVLVNNPHPKAKNVSARAVRDINLAIVKAGGPPNCVTCIEEPSIKTSQYLMTHPKTKMIVVTGGHGVIKFAAQTGKKVIPGGPGNPPVVVDESADLQRAAQCIVEGASFANCTPCASEKEIFAVDSIADRLKDLLKKSGACEIDARQGEELMKHIFKEVNGPGKPGVVNMEFVGKSPEFILKSIGLSVGPETKIVLLETDVNHPLVWTEQIMPVIAFVRCQDADQAINRAVLAEQGCGHTIVMHSNNLKNLAKMAGKANVCSFVKNGPSLAGVGVAGEGFISFHIATDGAGHTRPRTFTRMRRCAMVDDFRLRFSS